MLLAFAAVLFLLSCASTKRSNPHNRSTALDWAGVYTGTLPCVDCDGIVTTVKLYNNTYEKETQYKGKGNQSFTESGSFVRDKSGNKITLKSGEAIAVTTHYAVGKTSAHSSTRRATQ